MAKDPEVTNAFEHIDRPGNVDFTAGNPGYEVTTSNPATVALHLARDYVDALVTYEPTPPTFGF